MEKGSSTAFVRAILRGALSPKSITRAAAAMKPGKFRTVKPLGSGVYNKADLIVGNVGSHAGVGVRKLPTHKFVNPKQNYRGVKAEADRINKRLKRYNERPAREELESGWPLVRQPIVPQAQVTGVGQAIAPYYHVGDRGAFQHFTGSLGGIESAPRIYRPGPKLGKPGTILQGRVWNAQVHPQADKYLSDLHPGNYGPGGQIHDFMSRRRPGIGSTEMYPPLDRFDTGMRSVPKLGVRGAKRLLPGAAAKRPLANRNSPSSFTSEPPFFTPHGDSSPLNIARTSAVDLADRSSRWTGKPMSSSYLTSEPGSPDAIRKIVERNLANRNTLIHKWYDGMSQAQRAAAPGYTPPLRPIREGIVDAWSASPPGVLMDALSSRREAAWRWFLSKNKAKKLKFKS